MRTRSIIEFANTVYCIHTIFIGTIYYTRLLQTSEQRGDKNTAISSNAQLATSAEREVPRATCNERKARSSPRNLQQARSAKFPAQLATSAEREVPRATCNKRGARSSPRNLQQARSAKFPAQKSRVFPITQHTVNVARCVLMELQSAFIPFMTSERMSYKSLRTDKRKTLQRFSSPDFSNGDISYGAFYRTSCFL